MLIVLTLTGCGNKGTTYDTCTFYPGTRDEQILKNVTIIEKDDVIVIRMNNEFTSYEDYQEEIKKDEITYTCE